MSRLSFWSVTRSSDRFKRHPSKSNYSTATKRLSLNLGSVSGVKIGVAHPLILRPEIDKQLLRIAVLNSRQLSPTLAHHRQDVVGIIFSRCGLFIHKLHGVLPRLTTAEDQ